MTLTNPFSSLPSVATNQISARFPQSLPASATTAPFVGATQSVTFDSTQIANVESALVNVLAYYSPSSGYNPFGITPLQLVAINQVLSYFYSITAGTYTVSISDIQAMVTVSQFLRSLDQTYLHLNNNIDYIVALEHILKTVSITNAGVNYTPGVYPNIPLISTTGSGVQAVAKVTVSNLGTINSLDITRQGNLPGTTGFSTVNLTGGTGTGAQATLYRNTVGTLASVTVHTPGTAYTNGTYYNVPLESALAYNASGTITIAGGAVTSVIVTSPGSGYFSLPISINPVYVGGTGTGFSGDGFITPDTTSGIIQSTNIINHGTGYNNGTYTNVPLLGGSGTDAVATIDVVAGRVILVTITNGGGGYQSTDNLTVDPIYVGGAGTGFTCNPIVRIVGISGTIQSFTILLGGAGYVVGKYYNVPILTSSSTGGGYGVGATANITVTAGTAGEITSITVGNSGGKNYVGAGDTLTVAASYLGGSGSGFTCTAQTIIGVSELIITNAGSGYTNNDVLSVNLAALGWTGTAPTFTVKTNTGVTGVAITQGGFGYLGTDILTVLNTSLNSPNGTSFTCTPSTWQSYSIQQVISPFPNGATTVVSNDGYFIVDNPNTGEWWVSNNQDGTTWNALSYALLESKSDNIIAVDALTSGQIILFGSQSIEIWSDAGTYPFPYQRINGLQQDIGLGAKWSRANYGSEIIFLGQYYQGNAQIMMTQGNAISVISTSDIDEIINSFNIVSDAIGFTYVSNGHKFYEITFPTANQSFLYDFTTNFWSQVQSGIWPTAYRHLSNFGITFNNNNYSSDCSNGNIYLIDEDSFTDNGSLIQREVDSMHIHDEGNEFSISLINLDMALGVGTLPSLALGDSVTPQITLQVSKDSGNTFGLPRSVSMNPMGQYLGPRANWRRACGHTRDAVLKFKMTSAVQFIINAANAVIRKGSE